MYASNGNTNGGLNLTHGTFVFIFGILIIIAFISVGVPLRVINDKDSKPSSTNKNSSINMSPHIFKMPKGAFHPLDHNPNVWCVGDASKVSPLRPLQFIIVHDLKHEGSNSDIINITSTIQEQFLQRNQSASTECNGPIINGVRWTTREPFYVDTRGSHCMSDSFIQCVFQQAVDMWQSVMGFKPVSSVNLAQGSGVEFNGRNEASFGEIDLGDGPSSTIAITSVWWDGSKFVEADQMYNTFFKWGNALLNSSLMDLLHIVIHELGHLLGLTDIYQESCRTKTVMFGFASAGDTSYHILKNADINGLDNLGYPVNAANIIGTKNCPGHQDKCASSGAPPGDANEANNIKQSNSTITVISLFVAIVVLLF